MTEAEIKVDQYNMAVAETAEREMARRYLIPFSERVFPKYLVGRHHRFVADILQRAMNREPGYNRLVIHEPPQHGKSLQVSTLFPAWYMGHNPEDPIIITAYGDDHAAKFSRKIRNIIPTHEYQSVFPGIDLAQDSKAANRWELTGGHQGSMLAAGIFGRITGNGAKLLIIDDPIKNREEAESKLHLQKLIDEIKSTLYTRLHDDAIVIFVQTRWVQGDPAGWALNHSDDNYRYIKIPALSEGAKEDPLGRRKDEVLWPERFPQKMIKKTMEILGSYAAEALYQGNPSPPEGLLFKRKHFDIVPHAPKGLSWVRYWDLATSEANAASYTASGKAAVTSDGHVYIDGVIRGKWAWPYVRKLIKQIAQDEKRDVMIGIESQSSQKGMVQEFWADPEMVDFGIIGIPVSVSKRIRSISTMARGEAGKLHLVKGAWNDAFIQEHIEFDTGDYDDQVDMSSGCMHMLGMSQGNVDDLNDYLTGDDDDSYEDNVIVFDEYEDREYFYA